MVASDNHHRPASPDRQFVQGVVKQLLAPAGCPNRRHRRRSARHPPFPRRPGGRVRPGKPPAPPGGRPSRVRPRRRSAVWRKRMARTSRPGISTEWHPFSVFVRAGDGKAGPRPDYLPQHFLYFLPLPQGHGSFRPAAARIALVSCAGPYLFLIALPAVFISA